MDTVNNFQEKLNTVVGDLNKKIRKAAFGENNERLDFLMDSFYKLDPQRKNYVLAGAVALLIMVIFTIIGIYVNRINSLKDELNFSIQAMHEFEEQKNIYNARIGDYQKLVNRISTKVNAQSIKPFFENLTKKHKVNMDSLNESSQPIAADNPLGKDFSEANVDLRFNKISIPKLLKFMVAIEAEGAFLKIHEIKIEARHEDKLFFDAQVKVKGFKAK